MNVDSKIPFAVGLRVPGLGFLVIVFVHGQNADATADAAPMALAEGAPTANAAATANSVATANSMATATNAVAMALECLLLALEQHLHDCEQHHHDLSHRLRLLLASLLSLALGGQSSR